MPQMLKKSKQETWQTYNLPQPLNNIRNICHFLKHGIVRSIRVGLHDPLAEDQRDYRFGLITL
jgi:hypothetical protein